MSTRGLRWKVPTRRPAGRKAPPRPRPVERAPAWRGKRTCEMCTAELQRFYNRQAARGFR